MQVQYIAGVEQTRQAQYVKRYNLYHQPVSFSVAPRLLHWIDNQYSESTVVRCLTSPRLEFGAAAIYEYSEHLYSFLNGLPARPGVHLFHDESGTMPLYIGKNINIRSRVLSHLRTPDEAAMLRQSRRIDWVCIAGEIGALLLEARLIKEQQPLSNKRLRRSRQLYTLQLDKKRVDVVHAGEVDFSQAPNLSGLFVNRHVTL